MTTLNVLLDGGSLHAEVDGPVEAPALLLWNGALCTLRMWDAVVPRLAQRFRVVRFDIRGTGRSKAFGTSDEQFRFEQYAEDVNRLLAELSVERMHIWAMAWGSRAALAYAAWNPQRVVSLALFDASIDRADPEAQKAGARRALAAQVAAGLPAFAKPDGWNRHDDLEVARRAMTASGRIVLESLVPSLSMPVLVATGNEDPNLVSSRRLTALAPNAQLVVMPQVGHMSVLQRPDLTCDLFLRHVDLLAGRSTSEPQP